jgi:hypothetical protein
MKSFLIAASISVISLTGWGQRENKQSPIAKVSGTTTSGTHIAIRYNQPSVRGRTIGKDLEPMAGKVWRTGADSTTAFSVDKNVMVEGKSLPAGRYGLFTLVDGNKWTIIFSKNPLQWGAFTYKQDEDALRVDVTAGKTKSFQEKFTITVSKDGKVDLLWGDSDVVFTVK